MNKNMEVIMGEKITDNNAMYKLSYGLFVLTACENGTDNGCITNTVIQVTGSPLRIAVALNKKSYTHDMITATGRFNVSVLTEDAPFEIFERFGFKSGREYNKFADFGDVKRSKNGLVYLTKCANSFISAEVVEMVDCGTHTLFVAAVMEAEVLSEKPSVTYAYYLENIKPKPVATKKKGFVCKVCGYVYEGEELPEDYVCPLCGHGAEDFEPV